MSVFGEAGVELLVRVGKSDGFQPEHKTPLCSHFFFQTDVVAAERALRVVRRSRTPRLKRSPLLFAKNLSAKSFLRVLRYCNVVKCVCLNRANGKRGFGHEIALDMAISQFAHTPKPHRGCTSAMLVRRFASDGITYALTSRRRHFRNSIARGGSLSEKYTAAITKIFSMKRFS